MKKYFELALDNIIKYGDTDIFPFPIENHIFFDNKEQTLDLLMDMFKNFNDYLIKVCPINENMLTSSGYTGFRWATQLDPIWNAYFLGITLSIAEQIEYTRISVKNNMVFSYRIKLDYVSKTIFDTDYGWTDFNKESLKKAKEKKFILVCDISNFYSNIYHHRLENSLAKLDIEDKRAEKHIMEFLQNFSGTKSYGLPIGGQASRILAELLLNRTDKLLKSKGIDFCRFVDDYHIFANSKEELYENLIYLSTVLINNEGLLLQKSKTRIMTSEEFINNSDLFYVGDNEVNSATGEERKLIEHGEKKEVYNNLFSISLRYDPYSMTAEDDYEKLKKEVNSYDIMGLLSQELNKSRIHTPIMKKLINTIKYLDDNIIDNAILSLIDNIDVLIPVYCNLMILIDNIFERLSEKTKTEIIILLYGLIKRNNYIMQTKLNLAYSIRILAKKRTDENEELLIKLYELSDSVSIKRDIIIILSNWGCDYWISDLKNKYSTLDEWSKRGFILVNYILRDEGKHWRDHHKSEFNSFHILYRDWMAQKVGKNKGCKLDI